MKSGEQRRVRLAGSGDAAKLAALYTQFRDWLGRSAPTFGDFELEIKKALANGSDEFLIASNGDESVGVCALTFRPSIWASGQGVCCLEDLYVASKSRGSGVGRELLDEAVTRAAVRGCYRIELDVNALNGTARSLYERAGFDATDDHFGGANLMLRRTPRVLS